MLMLTLRAMLTPHFMYNHIYILVLQDQTRKQLTRCSSFCGFKKTLKFGKKSSKSTPKDYYNQKNVFVKLI